MARDCYKRAMDFGLDEGTAKELQSRIEEIQASGKAMTPDQVEILNNIAITLHKQKQAQDAIHRAKTAEIQEISNKAVDPEVGVKDFKEFLVRLLIGEGRRMHNKELGVTGKGIIASLENASSYFDNVLFRRLKAKDFQLLKKILGKDPKNKDRLAFNEEFKKVLHARQTGQSVDGFLPNVVRIADALLEAQDVMLKSMQDQGMDIGRFGTRYTGARTHDAPKIVSNRKKWYSFLMENMDWEVTAKINKQENITPEWKQAFLNNVFDSLTTDPTTVVDEGKTTTPIKKSFVVGPRQFVLKNIEADATYNKDFGTASDHLEGMWMTLKNKVISMARYQAYGPNPEAYFADTYNVIRGTILKKLQDKNLTNKQRVELNEKLKALENNMGPNGTIVKASKVLAGLDKLPEETRVSEVLSILKDGASMSFLHSVQTLEGIYGAMIEDATVRAHFKKNMQTQAIVGPLLNIFKMIARTFKFGLMSKQQKAELGLRLGRKIHFTMMSNNRALSNMDAGVPHGFAKRMTSTMANWSHWMGDWSSWFNLTQVVTDSTRTRAAMIYQNKVNENLHLEYKDVDEGVKSLLKDYGIGEREWKFMQEASVDNGGGLRTFDLKILDDHFQKNKKFWVKEGSKDLSTAEQAYQKFRRSYIAAINAGVNYISPLARPGTMPSTRAQTRGSTNAAFWDSLMQFVATTHQAGVNGFEILRTEWSQGKYVSATHHAGTLMAAGALIIIAKELRQGRDPYIPGINDMDDELSEEERQERFTTFMMKSFAMGAGGVLPGIVDTASWKGIEPAMRGSFFPSLSWAAYLPESGYNSIRGLVEEDPEEARRYMSKAAAKGKKLIPKIFWYDLFRHAGMDPAMTDWEATSRSKSGTKMLNEDLQQEIEERRF